MRSRGSTRSDESNRSLYPEHIPLPMMLEQTLMGMMRPLAGIFYGYDRSLNGTTLTTKF